MAPIDLRFVSGPDVAALQITDAEVIAAVEGSLRAQGDGEVVLEPREHLVCDPAFEGHFNVLRAYVAPLDVAGVKVVGDYVNNFRHGLESELALVTLYDPRTGVPRAILDATEITERRTGALTAVGARHLARPDSRVLGHIGARGTAFANVTMLASLFDLDEIRVTSARAESREAFGRSLEAALGRPVTVCATAREVAEGADIVVEATRLRAPEPVLRTEWIGEGACVIPYGTISALDLDLPAAVDKIVIDDWSQFHRGPFGALRPHIESGRLTDAMVHGELAEIVVGRKPGRETPQERTLFWHRGLATNDLAVAQLIYERAVAGDTGTVLRYR